MHKTDKQLVVDGFREFAAGNVDVLRTLLHENFIEHSPGNPSGREDFIEFVTTAPVAGAHLELARVIAEDDYVVLHYRMSPGGDEPDVAVVDIWRLESGQIIEHWDVVQPVPEPDQIPNGMF